MIEHFIPLKIILKYLSVFFLAIFKYVGGVALAIAYKFNFWEQFLTTFLGGCSGVFFFVFLEQKIKNWWQKKFLPKKTQNNKPNVKRWHTKIWNRIGLLGTAILTPPFFGPPIGTTIAIAFGTPPIKIFLYYIPSFFFWSIIFSYTHKIRFNELFQWLSSLW